MAIPHCLIFKKEARSLGVLRFRSRFADFALITSPTFNGRGASAPFFSMNKVRERVIHLECSERVPCSSLSRILPRARNPFAADADELADVLCTHARWPWGFQRSEANAGQRMTVIVIVRLLRGRC